MAYKTAKVAHKPLDHPTAHQLPDDLSDSIPEQKRAAAASARFREDNEMEVPETGEARKD